jgi:hypothetical protein
MFNSLSIDAFDSNVVDSQRFAKSYQNFIQSIKQNVLEYRVESLFLNDAQTRNYTLFPGYTLSDWWILYAKVIGKARFTINYDDPLNPLTTITSNITAYGTDNFPGVYSQSVVGLTPNGGDPAIKITGLQNSTNVIFLWARAAADNNSEWIANK